MWLDACRTYRQCDQLVAGQVQRDKLFEIADEMGQVGELIAAEVESTQRSHLVDRVRYEIEIVVAQIEFYVIVGVQS